MGRGYIIESMSNRMVLDSAIKIGDAIVEAQSRANE